MPKVAKTCVVCSSGFEVWPNREKTAITCSRICSGKWQAMGYAEARARKECAICKKEFFVPQSHAHRRNCCSRKCSAVFDSLRDHPVGELSKNWKGGISVHSSGYLYMQKAGHPFTSTGDYVFVHRLVVEEWMRQEAPDHKFLVEVDGEKFLAPNIAVHHRDEDKRNNVRENLVACTRAAHQLIHEGKAPMVGTTWPEEPGSVAYEPTVITCKCEVCGEEFQKKRSEVKRGSGKYCTRTCYNNRPLLY